MIVARIGALVLLVGLGFAVAQVAVLAAPVAAEGYGSWLPLLALLVPPALLALVSAVLVLRRRPLGVRLVPSLVAVVAAAALVALLGLAPVGPFLADYERAALARGVDVPPFWVEQGWTERDYVERRADDARVSGAVGALAAVGVYALLVRFGQRDAGDGGSVRRAQ